jgi:glutamine synthetase
MSETARKDLKIASLPGSLSMSLEFLKSDHEYLKSCFHGDLIETHLMLKQDEVAAGKTKKDQFALYHDI